MQRRPLPFAHLTIQDRLSHNTVTCLLQDQYGYIWAGTNHGLNQFDGFDFRVFRSTGLGRDSSGFRGEAITALLEDAAGRLWVGTWQHGLNLRPAGAAAFINLHQDSAFAPIQGHPISALFEDRQGSIWIGTIGAGLLRYDPGSQQARHYCAETDGLANDLVFDLIQDDHGTMWVATAGVGLHRLEANDQFLLVPETNTERANVAGYRKSLYLDADTLWIGTEGSGLYRLDISQLHCERIVTDPPLAHGILDITGTSDGRIFLATNGEGLEVYTPATGQLTPYTYSQGQTHSLNTDALVCLMVDRAENLWVGSYNGGINVHWAQQAWFDHILPQASSNASINPRSTLSLLQSRSGKVWIGTDGGGLFGWDPASEALPSQHLFREEGNASVLPGNVVKSLYEDSRGQIWIGTYSQGLSRYDPRTGTHSLYQEQFWNDHSLGGNNVWAMAERRNGELWIATVGGGVSVWQPASDDFRVYRANPEDPGSLIDPNAVSVYVDRSDQVWIGTLDKGLEQWDDSRQAFIHHRHDPADSTSLSHDAVRVVFEDRQGHLWIGTEGGGLNRWLGNGRFERIGPQDGLVDPNVMGITEDQAGWLWVATLEGITRLHPETRDYQAFDFRGEVNTNQFNHLALLTLADGRVLGGGIAGIHAIHPEQLRNEAPAPDLFFTDLMVFNQRVAPGPDPEGKQYLRERIEMADTIFLDYSDKAFSIFFSSTRYDSRSQFAYRMRGFNERWQRGAPGQNSATYTGLPPGSYEFEVELLDQREAITVMISPPYWETTWFRILIGLLVASAILLSIYLVLRRREKQHQREMLLANSKILSLENERLNNTLKTRNAKLLTTSAQVARKNELLSELKAQVQALQKGSPREVKSILSTINSELRDEKYWEEFDFYINHVDKAFTQAIMAKHPELTHNDLRICLLIRLNLSTKEMASLLNITPRGVEQSRYRLKKRLELPKEVDLRQYIIRISPAESASNQ